ncbi:glutamine amidotransferase, class I [Burkholderia humptydooensis MSMB43]|uniref:Glutamine amidotransferase, class I n=1 Tax=Burkholderia humptydooensis MSMB43 TaxID=441157 RepID=A0ABN0FXP9_9BURK|nr:glutamine amidotransferase, class I [Burkholderia humptydooensis MSMB43]
MSVADTQSLALGVQGYLEWQYVDNPLSRAIICSIRRGMPRSA